MAAATIAQQSHHEIWLGQTVADFGARLLHVRRVDPAVGVDILAEVSARHGYAHLSLRR